MRKHFLKDDCPTRSLGLQFPGAKVQAVAGQLEEEHSGYMNPTINGAQFHPQMDDLPHIVISKHHTTTKDGLIDSSVLET